MTRLFWLLLLAGTSTAHAIVIRDDVPDAQYRIAATDFPALVDLPMEAHGVLIAPQWVVTAAHAVSPALDCVEMGGVQRAVRRVVIHPGYRQPPQAMVEAALASGDWAEFFEFQAGTDDIALIELVEPVQDIAPVALFEGSARGETVRILGRGATGTGAEGHRLDAPRRNALRRGYNVIDVDEGRWLAYTFDAPPAALPLEASMGSGDSGGPLLIAVGDGWQLAGVAAWKRGIVEGTEIKPGKYGESGIGVRLQHYAEWMAQTMARAAPQASARHRSRSRHRDLAERVRTPAGRETADQGQEGLDPDCLEPLPAHREKRVLAARDQADRMHRGRQFLREEVAAGLQLAAQEIGIALA